jgi:hypothetical protein
MTGRREGDTGADALRALANAIRWAPIESLSDASRRGTVRSDAPLAEVIYLAGEPDDRGALGTRDLDDGLGKHPVVFAGFKRLGALSQSFGEQIADLALKRSCLRRVVRWLGHEPHLSFLRGGLRLWRRRTSTAFACLVHTAGGDQDVGGWVRRALRFVRERSRAWRGW